MSGIMGIKRCGTCFFAKLNPQIMAHDITKRVCFGAPPSAIQLQTQGGGMTLQMARPVVGVSEDACALWQPKDADAVAHDDAATQQLQMSLSVSGTKQ